MVLRPEQCRAARGLLGWSIGDLAEKSHVTVDPIGKFERGVSSPKSRTMHDLRTALEAAGVEFLEEDEEGGVGVRFKKGFVSVTPDADAYEASPTKKGGRVSKVVRSATDGISRLTKRWRARRKLSGQPAE